MKKVLLMKNKNVNSIVYVFPLNTAWSPSELDLPFPPDFQESLHDVYKSQGH